MSPPEDRRDVPELPSSPEVAGVRPVRMSLVGTAVPDWSGVYLPCKHSRCSDRGRLGASPAVLTVTLVCSGRETRDFVYAVYGTIVTVKNV